MIKIAQTDQKVVVTLSNAEFKYLAQVAATGDVPDGTAVSLTWLRDLVGSVQNFETEIGDAKTFAENLAVTLGLMLP